MNRPVVPAAAPWPFPEPRRTVLDNGLQVLSFHRPGQHLINATLVLDLPLNLESPSQEGISSVLQRCLDEGTVPHPGTSFADELEGRGAVLTGGSSHHAAHLSLEVPSTRIAAALPLLAEAVREPELEDHDVRRIVDLRLAEIAQQRAHPAQRGAMAFREVLIDPRFRAARPAAGTAETVAAITPAAVRAQHRAHYGPRRGTLILAGDLAEDPLPLIEQAFGEWTAESETFEHEIPLATQPRTVLIHRPAAVQADVRMGAFGLDRRDPRWPALRLGSFVLGGGFLSRLNRVLREQRGYTYGVQLSNAPARHGGQLSLHASFRTEVASAAIAEARELVRTDGDRSITTTELTEAVNFLVGITPLRCATAAGITDQVAALVEVGLDAGYVNRHSASLLRVTREQATEAVHQLLPPDGLTMVVVGDADALVEPLAAQGLAPELVIDEH